MEYIAGEKPKGCIFCRFPQAPQAEDPLNLLVHRSAHSFVCLNRYPYNSGHLLVVPRAHLSDLDLLEPGDFSDLQRELRRAVRVLGKVYRPDGLNVGMNLGQVAGAGIADHLHWHVVPRWGGDTNFMPVLANTRVVVEALDEAWRRLSAAFAEDDEAK
jgi:ATP adenylyltransferase